VDAVDLEGASRDRLRGVQADELAAPVEERFHRFDGHEPPVPNDADAVAQLSHLAQDVRGENTVSPRSRSARMNFANRCCNRGSNPLVGSSKITRSGSCMNVVTSPSFWTFPEYSRTSRSSGGWNSSSSSPLRSSPLIDACRSSISRPVAVSSNAGLSGR